MDSFTIFNSIGFRNYGNYHVLPKIYQRVKVLLAMILCFICDFASQKILPYNLFLKHLCVTSVKKCTQNCHTIYQLITINTYTLS